MNSESKVPTVYPVETNSREGKLQLVLETVMTIGPGFFQIFLEQARFFTNYIVTSTILYLQCFSNHRSV